MRLKDQIALVTGASSGIGREIAKVLWEEGASLVLSARREKQLEEIVHELNSKRSNSASFIVADLAKEDDLSRVVNFILENRVDILVNNAGRGSFGYYEDLKFVDEKQMLRLNVEATLALSSAVIPQLKERRSGGIISVSSIAGFQPVPFMATYSATKAFNLSHSTALWAELRPYGVCVTTVCPGPVATEFGGVARVPGTFTGGSRDSAGIVARQSVEGFINKKRLVTPGLRGFLMSLPARVLPSGIATQVVHKILHRVLMKAQSSIGTF